MSAVTHIMSETIFNVSVHLVPIYSGYRFWAIPEIPPNVPTDAVSVKKRRRTFSDSFVLKKLDLGRFGGRLGTSSEGYLVALTGIEPVF